VLDKYDDSSQAIAIESAEGNCARRQHLLDVCLMAGVSVVAVAFRACVVHARIIAANGGKLSFTNTELAIAIGKERPDRPLGNLISRLDFACYVAGLPSLGCAAPELFSCAGSCRCFFSANLRNVLTGMCRAMKNGNLLGHFHLQITRVVGIQPFFLDNNDHDLVFFFGFQVHAFFLSQPPGNSSTAYRDQPLYDILDKLHERFAIEKDSEA
jgi:hypothetical protein